MQTLPRYGYHSAKKVLGRSMGRSSIVRSLKKFFHVYCENSGLHGFRYIVTAETRCERAIWFAICVAAIFFCLALMLRLWEHFSNNPTVTIIDTSNPIKDLQFPGITICNNNKVYGLSANVIARKLLMNGFDISMTNRLFSSLMKLIRPDKIEIDNATAAWALDTLGYTVEKLMFELMQPCNALLVRCSWLGQIYNCNKIFKTVKSNEGFCCGFNYHYDLSKMGNDSWLADITMTEEPMESDNSSELLPGVNKILRAPGSGRDIGLSVALNIDAANYKSSIRQFIGANVLVHDPIDYPDVGAQTSSLVPGHVMTLALSGTKVSSSENIRNIPLNKRMCLFDGESPGENKYSYQTCISECIQQNAYTPCGCLPFFYPDEHPDVRTCYLTDVDCILTRRNILSESPFSKKDCNCLPQCNDESYKVVSESIRIDNLEYDSELTHGLYVNNISFLYVYFGDGSYIEYRTETILGWDSLLASFGGIFGLCLGGSVISFVEFLYYLISELLAARRKKRKKLRDENLPPASRLFVPGPTNKDLRKADKCLFYVRNEQLPRRTQRSTLNFKNDGVRPVPGSGQRNKSLACTLHDDPQNWLRFVMFHEIYWLSFHWFAKKRDRVPVGQEQSNPDTGVAEEKTPDALSPNYSFRRNRNIEIRQEHLASLPLFEWAVEYAMHCLSNARDALPYRRENTSCYPGCEISLEENVFMDRHLSSSCVTNSPHCDRCHSPRINGECVC